MIAGIALCAGFGTRLRPVTDSVPKPAIPFLGRPMVWYALHAMKAAGITRVAANVHHLPGSMSDCLEQCCRDLALDAPAVYNECGEIRGTAGGARACMTLMPDAGRFVIYHGDVLCSVDLTAALESHQKSGADVTLVVAPRPENTKLGYVGVQNDCVVRIRDWKAAAFDPAASVQACCFTGIHIVERAVLESVADNGYACLVTEIYPSMFAAGKTIHAFRHEHFFADVGTPQTYIEAQRAVLADPGLLPGARTGYGAELSAHIIPPVSISDDVSCGRCTIGPNVCLSHGAAVKSGEVLSDCMRFGAFSISYPV